MKFVELIDILSKHHTLKQFIENDLVDTDFDFIDLFIESESDAHSSVLLLDVNQIATSTSVLVENTCFVSFMPLNLVLELVVDIQRQKGEISCQEITQEVLDYRTKVT